MREKVEKLLSRLHSVEELLGKPETLGDQEQYRKLTQEHSYLIEVRDVWQSLEKAKKQLIENKELLAEEKDAEFREVLSEDIHQLEKEIPRLETQLETLLVPPDPTDHRNTILELRAGTGGDEASLFVADCVRMYQLFADKMGWSVERLSASETEVGGYKEYVMCISGKNAYRFLKHEGGTHRVQRVPDTETQGRVHTSAITVAVMIEPDEKEEIVLDESDLRIDTFRASGAGGQHVNVTDSAVRITHIPTGVVVSCQEERSQHKNKAKAMRLLQAKIAEAERLKQEKEMAQKRASQVGSGDRSERIRTYNFPQNRVTDHRINFTKNNLDRVMNGELDELIAALVAHFHQQQLKS